MQMVMETEREKVMLNRDAFLIRQPNIIGNEQFKQYAVMAPLLDTSEGVLLLFEKRSNKLKRQPGEICFPGGKLEINETLQECAIRETMEELQVLRHQIELIGPGDIYLSPFNLMIHPFIGFIKDYQDSFSTDEVAEIIKIPLHFFRNQQPEHFESRLIHQLPEDFPYDWIPEGKSYPWSNGTHDIFFYKYENQIIWGMTAHLVKSVVKLIDQYKLLE